MFVKYAKTFHLIERHGKFSLSRADAQKLLSGEVIVEEKLDGANTGIVRHKKGFHLQKRGSLVGQSEHEQFGYFHNWANVQNWEKIMTLPVGHILYGELLYATHTIYYDKLPDYWLCFDVWDGERFLTYDERAAFCLTHGFQMVPLVARGVFTKDEILKMVPKESAYGEIAEGIVVKRYTKRNYTRAKFVKPEFQKTMEESDHWTHGPFKVNKLV